MIRSSACQPWQPDLPGHAGDRGDLLSYTTPWDTIRKSYVTAQYLASRQRFERLRSSGLSDASISENALVEFEETWDDLNSRLEMIPGKEAMGFLSHHFQTLYGVMLTASAILDAMRLEEVPEEMRQIISDLSLFAAAKTSVTIERVAAA